LRRIRWHCQLDGSEAPIDRLLDEAETTISEGVREMACRLNQSASSFEDTSSNLARAAHIFASKETIRVLIESEGQSVLHAMRRDELTPTWTAADCVSEEGPTRMYIGCDGVKVPLVTDDEKQKRRAKVRAKRRRSGRKCKPLPRAKQGADSAYKDFKVAYLYDETKDHRYVGVTSGNHEAAGALLWKMAEHIKLLEADERIALIDGAPWIRNQIQFHGLTKDIGLDFYHLKENVQKARRVLYGEESEDGKQWLDALMRTFKHEGYDAVWEQLAEKRASLRSPRKRAAIKSLMQYVSERNDMIRYPEFLARGWQIGSGPTEAECKTTTRRVKGQGRRWNSEHAEAMMALAALDDSGLWNQHWQLAA
jgi:hypothetical protein